MTAYNDLMDFERVTQAIFSVAMRTSWDADTVMPKGSVGFRAQEQAALERVLHARRTDPRVAEWLSQVQPTNDVERANLRLIERRYNRNSRIPEKLTAELAAHNSQAQQVWVEARQDSDFARFAPELEKTLDLKREQAACLAAGGEPYDALLDDFEPQMTSQELQVLFDDMRAGLVGLRAKVLEATPAPVLSGDFAPEQQLALAHVLAGQFGYDFNTGRIDQAVHPFCRSMAGDVRITTRVYRHDPFMCCYATIHETGHACYEQGIDEAFLLTSLGHGVSMGVHESQARIYENQLGRSRAFTGWIYGKMRDYFGDFGVGDEETFYRAANRVAPGYIRVEADELSYNLHIMMRFDLERQLLSGQLEVRDLEDAWNSRFESDFGVAVDRASNGVLQDVHWSCGLFGYFPVYALGNVYAGCLYEAMTQALPALDRDLARGETASATGWLREHIHRHGSLYVPQDLILRACGKEMSEQPLLGYLERKFSALYDL